MRVILFTGYPSQELEAQVIHHGLCTYLSKAVDAQTLSRVIKKKPYSHKSWLSGLRHRFQSPLSKVDWGIHDRVRLVPHA
jgi:ActR/RegA family two-component response regulator